MVDREDAPKVEGYRWFMNRNGYAARQETIGPKKQRTVLMARVILGLEHGDKRQTDHISRDKLDNRRCNLRIVTKAQNAQNRMRTDGISKHRGVTLAKRVKKRPWQAYGAVNGKMTHVGYFATEDEAADAARAWRRIHLPFAVD
jgi:hypothetical protein